MSYETDEEKVEAIKKWWKENGVSVIAGAAIGLGSIFAWRMWVDHRDHVAGQASAAFEQLLIHATAANQPETVPPEAIVKQADLLQDQFGSTPYAAFGKLVAARALYLAGDAVAAMNALREALAHAPDPAIARVAALRLARIQVAEGQLEEARATLVAYDDSPAFAGDFAAIRGDIAAAQGATEAARAAYEQALEQRSGLSQWIRLKLDNLPAAG